MQAKSNKREPGGRKAKPERYEVYAIDRGFAAESARRNISVIVWYKRLIDSTLALLAASIVFTLIAIAFASFSPLPKVYASSYDGTLREIDYVRDVRDPKLATLRANLSREQNSRAKLLDEAAGIGAPRGSK